MAAGLKRALDQALATARQLREAGVSRLKVEIEGASVELELAPQPESLTPDDWEQIRAASKETEPSAHLDIEDLLDEDEQTMDAALGRLVSNSYGRPPRKEEPS